MYCDLKQPRYTNHRKHVPLILKTHVIILVENWHQNIALPASQTEVAAPIPQNPAKDFYHNSKSDLAVQYPTNRTTNILLTSSLSTSISLSSSLISIFFFSFMLPRDERTCRRTWECSLFKSCHPQPIRIFYCSHVDIVWSGTLFLRFRNASN